MVVLAGVAFLAVVVLDVPGGDDADPAQELARYCQLAGELDRVSLSTGAASAPGVYDGGSEPVKATVVELGDMLAALRSAAPEPVSEDVATVVAGLRAAARGDTGALQRPAFAATASRASAHYLRECANASGTSGGD